MLGLLGSETELVLGQLLLITWTLRHPTNNGDASRGAEDPAAKDAVAKLGDKPARATTMLDEPTPNLDSRTQTASAAAVAMHMVPLRARE